MTLKALIENISFIPSTVTNSQIIVDLFLVDAGSTETITEYGPLESLIKKYHIKKDGDNYDWSELQDKECLVFKNNEGYVFDKYI